jgi:hypothetical protein
MIVFEEVKKLEKLKEDLRKEGNLVSLDEDLTKEEKASQIGKISDEIFEIDQEIKRLKKMNPTVFIKEESINPIFILIGIAGIIFIINKNRNKK